MEQRGLSRAEVEERRRQFGPNVLPATAGTPAWRQLLARPCRSAERSAWRLSPTSNPRLIVAASIELVFALAMLLVGPGARFLDHEPPSLAGWVVALASMPIMLAVDAAAKAFAARRGPLRRAGAVRLYR